MPNFPYSPAISDIYNTVENTDEKVNIEPNEFNPLSRIFVLAAIPPTIAVTITLYTVALINTDQSLVINI